MLKVNGIYQVHQNLLKIIQVYCDQTADGGGWTVIQRRVNGIINFCRDWDHYKKGFGQLQKKFWLGLDNIFTTFLQGIYPRSNELRIDMKNSKGMHRYCMLNIENLKFQIVGNIAKGRISKRVFEENRARQIFRKKNLSYPLIRTQTSAYRGIKNVRFFGKFGVLCFLETSILRFALWPYYPRNASR